MKAKTSNLNCPSCQQPLQPKVLSCGACDIRVEGPFELNEFASLSAEDLHFLRIFVLAEGRIRDMQAPLGLSYPTIRARLKALKERIAGKAAAEPAAAKPSDRDARVSEILGRLKAGELTFEQAMELIRTTR